MISGTMPKRKQLFHTCVAAFIFVIFASAALVNGEMILPSHRPPVSDALRVIGFLFILLAIGVISMAMWYRRRIIREFQYDGITLHYQTLTIRHMQSRFPAPACGDSRVGRPRRADGLPTHLPRRPQGVFGG